MNTALQHADVPDSAEPAPEWLWARDVAAAAGVSVETITQYLWQAGVHERDEGRRRDTDIPPPVDHGRPEWRKSGAKYPRWRADGPIRDWIATRQPPGRPRNDAQPRTRRKATYAKPGRRPADG